MKSSTLGTCGWNRTCRSAAGYSCSTCLPIWPLPICFFLVLISALAAAQKDPPKPTAPSTYGGGSSSTTPGNTSIDEVVPPIQENSTCPLAQILHEVGQRATELVENLQRITAIERIEHTEFKKNGKPRMSSSERFDYTAEIEPSPSGIFGVYEYRTARGQSVPPPFEDTGTMALALIFLPKEIENFHVRCEGQTDLHGILAWQLWFEEGSDPAKQVAVFQINGSQYWMRFKGRAWISTDNYQVLRLQTDLVAPIPEINLQSKHSDVAYALVESASHKFRVWLPESASNRICYRSRCYLRAHSFSHFRFFLVETEQRVKEPVSGAQNSGLNEQ